MSGHHAVALHRSKEEAGLVLQAVRFPPLRGQYVNEDVASD